jgi:hypothetical protein
MIVRLPTRAELVRLVGGPTGPFVGAAGPVGPPGDVATTGATGLAGATGRLGSTGPVGPPGAESLFMGMLGATGPNGFPVDGPRGPKSADTPFPGQAYFENRIGLTISGSVYIGCKFSYISQSSGQFFVIATGLFTDTGSTDPAWFAINYGRPPSPNPGEPTLGRPGNVSSYGGMEIFMPRMAVPFTLISAAYYGQDQNRQPGEEFWFDLAASGVGKVTNISCLILEP